MGDLNFGGVTVNGGGQVQVGQNNGGMHQGTAPPPTVQSFFNEISKALPPDSDEQTQLAHEALGNVELMASTQGDSLVTNESKSSMMAILTPYVEKLAPYAPLITKALLGFGDGYFSTLESKNAVVAGLVEMIKGMRN